MEPGRNRVAGSEGPALLRRHELADLGELERRVVAQVQRHPVAEKGGNYSVGDGKKNGGKHERTEQQAELANAKAKMEVRVYELEPVAEQVPMLQAAVDEKDATLTGIQHDIEAIASRPVAGPVFRLLTKGKLRF